MTESAAERSGNGGKAAPVASRLSHLAEAVEAWIGDAPEQRRLIERNIRVLAGAHPTLAKVFRLMPVQ